MKTSIKLGFIAIAALSLSLSSCKKDSVDTSGDSEIIQENAASDAAFNDVAGITDEAYSGTVDSYRFQGDYRVMTTCATVTFDTSGTKKFIIDFGTTNCLCKDGNYRRGKINVTYSGFYRDSASTHTITFDNYFVNDNKLEGTKTVTNNGRNNAGNLTWTVTVNGTITWDASFGGGTSTYTSNRIREWSAGENTPFIWLDDEYLISGTAGGTTKNGTSYTMSTATALKVEIGFRHFTDGILEYTPQGQSTRSIDYGYKDAARDNLARVTISGVSFTITLR